MCGLVFFILLSFIPVHTQHNQCLCRCLLERRGLCLKLQDRDTHRECSKVVWPRNVNRNEHAAKKKMQTSTPDCLYTKKLENVSCEYDRWNG